MTATQQQFAAALLDPQAPVPSMLTAHSARPPVRRFAVYRNNVVVGLVNALRARFPATEKIVGEEFFFAMARVFVSAHPPRSKILSEYGDDFAAFIADFGPAAELAYLADVARLEAARTRAYHAADAQPLPLEAIAGFDPQRLAALRLLLHPSLQIVRSPHPVVTIWAMNAGERELAAIDPSVAEDALVVRPHMQVLVRQLPPGGVAFLSALAAGSALAAAAAAASDDTPGFDLAGNLAGMFAAGIAVNLS
jgi:hypothetical protein